MASEKKVNSYQDFIVWQKATKLAIRTYKITQKFPAEEKYGLVSQLRRAAVSIPSNIAEGYRRAYPKEWAQFLRIAYGSGSEMETQFYISKELGYISQKDYLDVMDEMSEVMKIINALLNKL